LKNHQCDDVDVTFPFITAAKSVSVSGPVDIEPTAKQQVAATDNTAAIAL
jgi:hypothetical protein